ncbi:hypothetical protein BaRGS_00007970, partial [Batillaria attramentaria]
DHGVADGSSTTVRSRTGNTSFENAINCPSGCRKRGDAVMECHQAHLLDMLQLASCVSKMNNLLILHLRSSPFICYCSILDFIRLTLKSSAITYLVTSCTVDLLSKCGALFNHSNEPTRVCPDGYVPWQVQTVHHGGDVDGVVIQQGNSNWRTATRRPTTRLWTIMNSPPAGHLQKRYRRLVSQAGQRTKRSATEDSDNVPFKIYSNKKMQSVIYNDKSGSDDLKKHIASEILKDLDAAEPGDNGMVFIVQNTDQGRVIRAYRSDGKAQNLHFTGSKSLGKDGVAEGHFGSSWEGKKQQSGHETSADIQAEWSVQGGTKVVAENQSHATSIFMGIFIPMLLLSLCAVWLTLKVTTIVFVVVFNVNKSTPLPRRDRMVATRIQTSNHDLPELYASDRRHCSHKNRSPSSSPEWRDSHIHLHHLPNNRERERSRLREMPPERRPYVDNVMSLSTRSYLSEQDKLRLSRKIAFRGFSSSQTTDVAFQSNAQRLKAQDESFVLSRSGLFSDERGNSPTTNRMSRGNSLHAFYVFHAGNYHAPITIDRLSLTSTPESSLFDVPDTGSDSGVEDDLPGLKSNVEHILDKIARWAKIGKEQSMSSPGPTSPGRRLSPRIGGGDRKIKKHKKRKKRHARRTIERNVSNSTSESGDERYPCNGDGPRQATVDKRSGQWRSGSAADFKTRDRKCNAGIQRQKKYSNPKRTRNVEICGMKSSSPNARGNMSNSAAESENDMYAARLRPRRKAWQEERKPRLDQTGWQSSSSSESFLAMSPGKEHNVYNCPRTTCTYLSDYPQNYASTQSARRLHPKRANRRPVSRDRFHTPVAVTAELYLGDVQREKMVIPNRKSNKEMKVYDESAKGNDSKFQREFHQKSHGTGICHAPARYRLYRAARHSGSDERSPSAESWPRTRSRSACEKQKSPNFQREFHQKSHGTGICHAPARYRLYRAARHSGSDERSPSAESWPRTRIRSACEKQKSPNFQREFHQKSHGTGICHAPARYRLYRAARDSGSDERSPSAESWPRTRSRSACEKQKSPTVSPARVRVGEIGDHMDVNMSNSATESDYGMDASRLGPIRKGRLEDLKKDNTVRIQEKRKTRLDQPGWRAPSPESYLVRPRPPPSARRRRSSVRYRSPAAVTAERTLGDGQLEQAMTSHRKRAKDVRIQESDQRRTVSKIHREHSPQILRTESHFVPTRNKLYSETRHSASACPPPESYPPKRARRACEKLPSPVMTSGRENWREVRACGDQTEENIPDSAADSEIEMYDITLKSRQSARRKKKKRRLNRIEWWSSSSEPSLERLRPIPAPRRRRSRHVVISPVALSGEGTVVDVRQEKLLTPHREKKRESRMYETDQKENISRKHAERHQNRRTGSNNVPIHGGNVPTIHGGHHEQTYWTTSYFEPVRTEYYSGTRHSASGDASPPSGGFSPKRSRSMCEKVTSPVVTPARESAREVCEDRKASWQGGERVHQGHYYDQSHHEEGDYETSRQKTYRREYQNGSEFETSRRKARHCGSKYELFSPYSPYIATETDTVDSQTETQDSNMVTVEREAACPKMMTLEAERQQLTRQSVPGRDRVTAKPISPSSQPTDGPRPVRYRDTEASRSDPCFTAVSVQEADVRLNSPGETEVTMLHSSDWQNDSTTSLIKNDILEVMHTVHHQMASRPPCLRYSDSGTLLLHSESENRQDSTRYMKSDIMITATDSGHSRSTQENYRESGTFITSTESGRTRRTQEDPRYSESSTLITSMEPGRTRRTQEYPRYSESSTPIMSMESGRTRSTRYSGSGNRTLTTGTESGREETSQQFLGPDPGQQRTSQHNQLTEDGKVLVQTEPGISRSEHQRLHLTDSRALPADAEQGQQVTKQETTRFAFMERTRRWDVPDQTFAKTEDRKKQKSTEEPLSVKEWLNSKLRNTGGKCKRQKILVSNTDSEKVIDILTSSPETSRSCATGRKGGNKTTIQRMGSRSRATRLPGNDHDMLGVQPSASSAGQKSVTYGRNIEDPSIKTSCGKKKEKTKNGSTRSCNTDSEPSASGTPSVNFADLEDAPKLLRSPTDSQKIKDREIRKIKNRRSSSLSVFASEMASSAISLFATGSSLTTLGTRDGRRLQKLRRSDRNKNKRTAADDSGTQSCTESVTGGLTSSIGLHDTRVRSDWTSHVSTDRTVKRPHTLHFPSRAPGTKKYGYAPSVTLSSSSDSQSDAGSMNVNASRSKQTSRKAAKAQAAAAPKKKHRQKGEVQGKVTDERIWSEPGPAAALSLPDEKYPDPSKDIVCEVVVDVYQKLRQEKKTADLQRSTLSKSVAPSEEEEGDEHRNISYFEKLVHKRRDRLWIKMKLSYFLGEQERLNRTLRDIKARQQKINKELLLEKQTLTLEAERLGL